MTDAAQPPDAPGEPPKAEPDSGTPDKTFIMVGIGASAGGLEALVEVIRQVPIDAMAFLVVQHLSPHHKSMLAELLSRTAQLKVVTAVDGATVEPNHVYVIPPNATLAVMHGVVRVMTPATSYGPKLPVDYLFRSLAEDQGPRAIGVVLSGTGSDGTLGLKAIKASGGFTFVQDPASAKYDGMPRSAISSGAADLCLSAKEIGEELARIAKHPHVLPRPRPADAPAPTQEQLSKLFVLIRSEFGNDLTQYKTSTIDRRVERRMMLHRMGRLEDYLKYVQHHREELEALYKDMLIAVTSFFRDPEAYESLKTRVLPQILERKEGSQPVRVWVPACATGEEAYSIAMLLLETCEEKIRDERIQVFGTDVDEESIQYARRGVYPANIALDVSPERLSRFFIKKDDEYHVARRVRDLLVFSRQNVLKDAPFSRIDLVMCRNLLIYLQPSAQKKVLRILHYALNPSGHLVLGTSETVGDAPDLFAFVDRKNKIYLKRHVAPQTSLDVGFGVPATPEPPHEPLPARPPLNLQGLADRKVLDLHGPPGVVVSDNLDILQFRGHTGPFLDPAPGTASLNLLKVARFELHIELKRAVQQALAEQGRVVSEVTYAEGPVRKVVQLDVVPLHDPETKTRCLLVLFKPLPDPPQMPALSTEEGGSSAALPLTLRIQELERELSATKDYLQTTIEEKESTLEELKSANEELQSSNEELQSTNEELETSKEEMQSTNEELTTVNEELQNRMTELSQTNDDLHNVLAGVDSAVVIVGMDLRIRRYTGAAERLFNLVPADIGRSIGFLDSFLGTGPLEAKVSAVIQNLSTLEEDILASNMRWYSLRISPYKTLDHAIRGALLTLGDIDMRKRSAGTLRDLGDYLAQMLAVVDQPLLLVDGKHRVVWCNDPFLAAFQVTREETVGSSLSNVAGQQLGVHEVMSGLGECLASGSAFGPVALSVRRDEQAPRQVKLRGSRVPLSTEVPLVLLSCSLPEAGDAGSRPA